MTESIIYALIGGGLIGLAASAMLYTVGRIAGISGIVGGILKRPAGDTSWRMLFLLGLLAGGAVVTLLAPEAMRGPSARSLWAVAAAGILVGFGTRMGNGCTSGHGVCGITRLSGRSIVGTLSFLVAGTVTATTMYLVGGAL
jgi:uncharacterized membrane protein YedE/YeeE